MKRLLLFAMLLLGGITAATAQESETKNPAETKAQEPEAKGPAEIKFEKTVHNFGEFLEKDGVQSCVFTFTNVGGEPLVINQAMASCGCTVPSYPKEPIMPGQKGELKVTYNGVGKSFGHFRKAITVRTNGSNELTRLYIEGTMKEK